MATAADLESAAKVSASAINLLLIGDRYYGMGNYAKAAEVYRQVLTKSDADKELANLHLGMALARAGDKAGATAALNAVTGSRSDISGSSTFNSTPDSHEYCKLERGAGSPGRLFFCCEARQRRHCPVSGWLRAAFLAPGEGSHTRSRETSF